MSHATRAGVPTVPARSDRLRVRMSAAVVALAIGVLTQPNVWRVLGESGIPRPLVVVDFLDSSGAFAAIAFAGGTLARRLRWSFLTGFGLQALAFVGYYAVWDWSNGAPGVVSWGLVAVLTGPVAGWLGYLWWHGRRWLVAAPLGFIVNDSVTGLVSVSYGADPAARFAGPVGGLVVVGVVLALVAEGAVRDRLRLVLLVVVAAAVAFAAFAFVLAPGLELVFLDCGDAACPPGVLRWPIWPDTGR